MVLKSEQLNTFFLCCQFLASERRDLHDDLCLIDPPVISFDQESLLNALLYSSDEFKEKLNRETLLCIIPNLELICAAPRFANTKTKKNNTWNFLFCKKILLICFYLQLEFDNYKHNCQPQVLSEILQIKTLYQVSFAHSFSRNLLIDRIESCLSNNSPQNK